MDVWKSAWTPGSIVTQDREGGCSTWSEADAHALWLKLGELLYSGKDTIIQPGEPILHPRGCICPPGADQSCRAVLCPRQPLKIT